MTSILDSRPGSLHISGKEDSNPMLPLLSLPSGCRSFGASGLLWPLASGGENRKGPINIGKPDSPCTSLKPKAQPRNVRFNLNSLDLSRSNPQPPSSRNLPPKTTLGGVLVEASLKQRYEDPASLAHSDGHKVIPSTGERGPALGWFRL